MDTSYLFFLICFLLKDNCFTESCCFVKPQHESAIGNIYPLSFEPPSHFPPHPTPRLIQSPCLSFLSLESKQHRPYDGSKGSSYLTIAYFYCNFPLSAWKSSHITEWNTFFSVQLDRAGESRNISFPILSIMIILMQLTIIFTFPKVIIHILIILHYQ